MNFILKITKKPYEFQRICHATNISYSVNNFCSIQQSNFEIKNNYETKSYATNQNTGIFNKIFDRFGWKGNSKTKLKMSSYLLYESVADGINYGNFFNDFNLPNTFNSWFLITELHVWMLLLRAMEEGAGNGETGRIVRNCIVEALWADVSTRAKKLGADNPSGVRHQVQILSQQFQAALITYDEGIMSDDKVLAGALWRRFFTMNCESFEQIDKLVLYVRQQVEMLDETSIKDLITNPNIKWIDRT